MNLLRGKRRARAAKGTASVPDRPIGNARREHLQRRQFGTQRTFSLYQGRAEGAVGAQVAFAHAHIDLRGEHALDGSLGQADVLCDEPDHVGG
jgi:hypothetical protein